MSASTTPSSAAALLATPVLPVSWPSMGSLMGAGNAGASAGSSGGGGGQWMRALEESGRVVTQYQQAHNWNMALASSGLGSAGTDEDSSSVAPRSESGDQPAGGSNGGAAAAESSSSGADDAEDADAGSSAELALDTELQTAAFLLSSGAAAAAASSSDLSSPSTTAPPSLRIPARLTNQWTREVRDTELAQSSFGSLYEKRMHVLRSLFAAFARHETQQLTREAQEAQSLHSNSGSYSNNLFKRPYSTAQQDSQWAQHGGGGFGKQQQQQLIAASTAAQEDLLSAEPTWPKLSARDPTSEQWLTELSAQQQQLQALTPLQLRKEYTLQSELQAWFAAAEASLLKFKDDASVGSALASIIGVSVSSGWPSLLLGSVRLLLRISQERPAVRLPASATPHLEHLSEYQNHLDISAPFQSAAQFALNQALPSQMPQAASAPSAPGLAAGSLFAAAPNRGLNAGNSSAQGLATDGTYLYVHTRDGLEKIGSGFLGSVRGQRYAYRPDFRNAELVRLAAVGGKLYALSSRMTWPRVEVLSADTLASEGFLQMGIDPEFSSPNTASKSSAPNHLMTDGRLLYLLSAEEGDENEAEATATECSEQILALLNDLESAKKSEVQVADLDAAKQELTTLLESLQTATEERLQATKLESFTSPRRKMAAAAQSKAASSLETKTRLPPAFGQRNNSQTKPAAVETTSATPSSSSTPAKAPGASSVSFVTPRKEPAFLKKVREAQALTTQLLAATRAANSAGAKTPSAPLAPQGSPVAAQQGGAGHFIYPSVAASSSSGPQVSSSIQAKAFRLLGLSGLASASGAFAGPASPIKMEVLSSVMDKSSGSVSGIEAEKIAAVFAAQQAALAAAGGAVAKPKKKQFVKLSLWVYDPALVVPASDTSIAEDLFLTQEETEQRLAEAEVRAGYARQIAESFNYAYSVRLCITALKRCNDDRNNACRWLLENGEEHRALSCVPLVRSLVIANNHPQLTADYLMQGVSCYVTSSQLVMITPPHSAPWTTDERSLVRVISLQDGLLFEESRTPNCGRAGSCITFDARNNLLWSAVLQHSVSVTAYTNHGPSAAVISIPSASDRAPETPATLTSDTVLASLARPSASVSASASSSVSSASSSSALDAPADVALFLLGHLDRNLKHRDISGAVEMPLLEHRRSQVQALSLQLDVLRAEVEALSKAKSASAEAAAMLDALPSMAALDVVEVNEFPSSPVGSDLEALLGALLSGERSALAALVDRRGGSSNSVSRQQSAARKFPQAVASGSTFVVGGGANGGRATLQPEQATARLAELQTRILLVESQLASVTASMVEIEARQSSAEGSFCPRAPTQPYCLEVADSMFSSLFSLMDSVREGSKTESSSGSISSLGASSQATANYTTEVCLRLLRVHLELLIKYTGHAANSTPIITRSRELRGLLLEFALSEDATPASSAASTLAASSTSAASAAQAALTVSLKALACSVLISGIKIFYPSQSERVALLTGLIAEFQSMPAPSQPSARVEEEKKEESKSAEDSSSSSSSSSAPIAPAAPVNKKMELLQGIMGWFSSQWSLSDILLVNKETESKQPPTPSSAASASSPAAAATAVEAPTAAAAPTVDTAAFIRSLIDFSLTNEFASFRASTRGKHSFAMGKPAGTPGASTVISIPPYPPALSLLLVLQQDLIRKSGLLCIPPSDANDAASASGLQRAQAQAKSSPFGKIKTTSAVQTTKKSFIPLSASAPAPPAVVSDDLPAGGPQLLSSDSSSVNASIWGGLSLQLQQPGAIAAAEVAFETALADSASSTAPQQPSVLNALYFEKLMDYTTATMERCESLIDDMRAEEVSLGGSKRSSSCVSFLCKNSILVLLPALLTSLGSPAFAAQANAQAMSMLPALQSLLTKLDSLNSVVPALRQEDAKYSRLLANEHTRSYVFETPHPYPSGFRVLKQTLSIPGANFIRFTFDPRSSSAGGNDSLRLFSDAAMTKPVGSVLYGNDRDGNATWPRNSSILTPGDTVTLCFSAKGQSKQSRQGSSSGGDPGLRFGFKCVARGVFIQTMPWLLDLQHTVSGLMGRVIQSAVSSLPLSINEMQAREWFRFGLMNRGLEDALQRMPLSGSATPMIGARGLEGRSAPAPALLSLVPAKPPALAFLDRFIDGAADTRALWAELDRTNVSFAGKLLVKRLPAPLQDQWNRALRATMAAMIKHAGLTQDVYSVFCEGLSSGSAASSSTEQKSADSLGNLSSRARALLLDRLKLVSSSAKSLQNWMMEQVQAHNEWNAWFSPTRMTTTFVSKKDRAKEASAKLRALADAQASAALAAALADIKQAEERLAAAQASGGVSSSFEPSGAEEDFAEDDEEDLGDYSDRSRSASEDDEEERPRAAMVRSARKVAASPKIKRPASSASSVSASPPSVSVMRASMDEESKSSASEEQKQASDDAQLALAQSLADAGFKPAVSPSTSPAAAVPAAVEEKDEGPPDLVYTFTFGLTELKEEYDASQASKVKALCSIKRIRLRNAGPDSNIDLDEALSKLLVCLERERREKQLHGRLHPAQAFHTLDQNLIKQNSYAIVIDQVYAMARALLCFKSMDNPASSLTPPISPGVSSSTAADSDDIPDGPAPGLGRAVSEFPGSNTHLLPPGPPTSLMSRTLSREVGRGGGSNLGGVSEHASHAAPEERAEELRNFVNTYSRWQNWQSAHQPLKAAPSSASNGGDQASWTAQQASPLDAIKNIVRANLDSRALVRVALAHQARAQSRQVGLEALARALDSVSFEVARVNLVGLLPRALQLSTAPESDSPTAAPVAIANSSSLFSGMETASVTAKASVQDAYEALMQVLLSLLKPSVIRSPSAPLPVLPVPSAHSALFTDAYVSPPRRNCYASRLLALTDIFAFPFSPLRLAATGNATPASAIPVAASAASALSLSGTSLSHLVPSSRRHLFGLLTDALSVSRYLRRLEPSIAEEVARDHLTLQMLVEREVALDRSEMEIRQAQEILNAQVAEDKIRREQQKIRDEEEKARKLAEAARVREERAARKAAEAAAGGDAAVAAAAAAASADDEDALMGAMNLFDSDSESASPAAAAPAGLARSVSDEERAARVAEQTARAEAEYLASLQRQFGDGSDQNGQNGGAFGGGRGAGYGSRKPQKSGLGEPAQPAFGGGLGLGGGASSGLDDGSESGHMTVVQNRHGQSRSVWIKGDAPKSSSPSKDRARKERGGSSAVLGGSQEEEEQPEEEDDVPLDDEPSADGHAAEKKSESSAGGSAITLPTIAELNSAFATKEWAALRLSIVQLLQWSEARVRAELASETEATRTAVLLELRSLRTSVLRQLTRELIAALDLARTLSRHHHSWHLRSKLLELLEQLLQLFLLISPVAFAAATASAVRSSAADAPAMQTMQQQLAITLLFLVQEHAALTPRITLLALRLARRVLPALDSDALWRSFVGQATTATSAESAAAAPPLVGSSLAEWLVQRIGALLTAESLAEYQKRQEEESNKRAELKAQAEAKRKAQAEAKAVAAAAAAAASGADAPSPDKSEASPTSPAVSSVKFLPKTHSLVAHFNDGFTVEQWATLLAQPAYIELAYGVRGVLPPKLEDLKLRAASEFERRQKLRKGPAKVACQPKSGSLEQTAELRISSRSGFSTFVGNVGVTGGKWCYQVQLATRGLLQIGWATAEHNPSSAEGQGTGDDVHSWAYDGMRLKRWHVSPAPYSTARWNAGDIVTCLLDLDVPGGEMSFMLNAENHGVAFKGFYNPSMGPIYPAASISASETATWIFDAARFQKKGSMKTRVPEGYATLEGDRITYGDPVPASRAAEIHRALEFAGHFDLLEADLAHCEQLARSLAAEHGCTLTVQPIDGLDSLSLTDATTPNDEVEARSGSNAYPKQVQTGAVAYAFASELIAFCRFLLDASKSEPAWASQMQSTLRQALHASPQLLQSEAALAEERVQINTLLGALCVLGGFTESVRVGGLIRVASSGDAAGAAGSAASRGLVVQANEHANHIRAIYLQELMQATNNGAASHSVESLSHRLAISQVIAVPELQAEFALDQQTFVALQKRIEAALPPALAASTAVVAVASMPSASAIAAPVAPENRSQYRWLLGELKWRSVAVLESLLTSVAPLPRPLMRSHSQSSATASASSSSSGDDMLIQIGELLVSHSRACRLELKLDNVSALSERLSQKAWDLRNVVDAVLAPVPFRRRAPIKSGPPANAPHANSFDTVYSSSSYREEKIAAPVADDALLRYWEKYIIPGIQNYVKGSFKPYEMENFFAQLRQPLRANNQAGAVEIAMTLTGGHIPDGMQFPDDSRDFLTLTLDDVRIGACYQVSPAAANSDLWIEAMDCTINMVGTAKAVHVGEELVLLQFYQPSHALLYEWWYPVEALKLVKSARNVQLSHLRDLNAVVSSLEETQSNLSALIARRAIFFLVARGGEACARFLQHQLDAGGLEPMLDWMFLSVSDCLELSDLNRLGQASGNQRDSLLAFQSNLISFLNAQRLGGGGNGSLSSSHLLSLCLKKFKTYISQAASFTKSKSITSAFQIQPPASPPAVVPGSPPPRSNEAADHWQHLHIDHASALVILFSKDTRLSKGSMLSLYPDESASELIKSYAGREESPQLAPLVASGGDVYLHCTQPQDISARSSLKILPISSFLPLAFWLVDLLLNARTSISSAAEPAASSAASAASASSSPPPASRALASSSGDWSAGFEDGGLVGLCYTLCEIILENYALSEIAPSPLKEALLKLVSSLISTITTAKHAEALNTSAASSGSAPMQRPAMQRQISEAKNASQARTLSILRQLHSEMVALYQTESVNLVFTSYLQQLVDLLAASDELRPNSDRLCSKFEFATALSPEEAAAKAAAAAKQAEEEAKKNAAPAIWVCPVCTFENAEAAPGCDMCGSAKPKGGAKKAAGGSDASSSSSSAQDSSQMFHDMMALVGAMRLLNGEVAVEESPACMAMMEACWRDARRDAVDKRLVIIENVPAGDRTLVAAALAKALRALDGTIRLDPSQIFIGTDPSKPPIKEPVSKDEAAAAAPARDFLRKGGKGGGGGGAGAAAAAAAASAASLRSSSNSSFSFKALGDENGVLYHLGALAKLETNQPKWVNPATTSVVLASASSTDSGCDPVSSIAGRESKRFATKNLAKSWVGLEFVGYALSLKKYTLRHAETPKTEALRGWKLEGSKDGRKWVVLDERKNDQNLSAKGVCYAYDVRQSPVTKEPFSQFRLTSTQPNSGNTHTLALGNIELYGTLKKAAEKAEPIATPHYAVIQLNSAIMDPASSGGVGAAPVAASGGGAKPGVPSHQALLDAIKQLCMPLHIRPAPPVDPVEEAKKAAAKLIADRAAAEADRIEAMERAAALAAQSSGSGFGQAPPSFAFGQSFGAPSQAFGVPSSSPFGVAVPAEPVSGFGKAPSVKPAAAKTPAAAAAAPAAAAAAAPKKEAAKDSKKPQAKEKQKKSDSRSQAEIEAERVARQRASDERRAKVEADKIARAQREREEEAERLEAAKHVQLGCIRWTDLPRSGEARSRHPIVNSFLRSKLVSGIEAELRGPNPAQPLKAPGVKSWGAYRPTPEFAAAVTELVVRHAGPAQNSPSLRGTPALDSHALQGFLSYAKLETQPALEKEVVLMRKQASLPTGLELELILQILCKIAGAPQVFPLPPAAGQEPVVAEAPVPSLSLAPPPEPASGADVPQPVIAPPQPEYDSGAFLLCEWLSEAGYDLNVQHHVDPSFHDALRFQQPGYWISQGQVQASRSVRPAATTTAATATGTGSRGGAADSDCQPVLAEEFVQLLHELADRVGEKEVLSVNPTQIILEESDWARISVAGGSGGGASGQHPHLPLPALRLRYSFLRLFNRLFSTLLPLIDLRRTVDARSIAGLVSASKPFLFPSVKNRFLSVILDATAEEAKLPQISVNRLALQMNRSLKSGSGGNGADGGIDFLTDTLFARSMKQVMKIDPFQLRPVRPAGTEPFLSFEVQFRGEQVVGEGGPFRQLFNDLGRELMDHSSPNGTGLLQPTPNNLAKVGDGRDKFCIRPGANSAMHLQFFQYLGLLFGCCLRTGVRFPLELSKVVWASILGEELTPSDLRSIDASASDSLAFIDREADASALLAMNQSFTTKLSDGTLVELKAGGEDEKVDMSNRREYVGLVVAARLVESAAQVDAIRRGIAKIVPIQLLNLLTPLDLELLICGRNSIDVDLLRRHTKLSGVDPAAPHLDYFWQVLQEFDQFHRRLFIKFCWAQERLPLDDAEFIRTHTRLLIKPSNYPVPDLALPRSDTCFFNLELPAYSSKEIMRSKLLFACTSDDSMNADEKSIRDAEGQDGRNQRRRFEEDQFE